MRFLIDMIHHNPGEPPFDTAFSDPGHLKTYGFHGQAFKHINTIATLEAIAPGIFPATGEDRLTPDRERTKTRDLFSRFTEAPIGRHQIRVSNNEATRGFHFLSVLAAAPKGGQLPTLAFPSEKTVVITPEESEARTISFDPTNPGDVTIDPKRAAAHAEESRQQHD